MGHSDEDGKNNRIEFLRFVIRNLSSSVRNVDRQLASRTISLEPNENRRSPKKKRKRLSLRISTARKKKKKKILQLIPRILAPLRKRSASTDRSKKISFSSPLPSFSFSFSFQKKESSKAGNGRGWARVGGGEVDQNGIATIVGWSPNPRAPSRARWMKNV